jgi:hypothetical protein
LRRRSERWLAAREKCPVNLSMPGFASTNPEPLLHSEFVSTNLETRCEGLDEDRKWEVRVKDGAGSIWERSVCKREAGENFGRGGSRDEIRRDDVGIPIRNLRQRPLTKRLGVKGPTGALCVTVANTGLTSARAKKNTETRNRSIESNGDSDSLFSAFLDVRSRRVKEVRVCHPGCFCFKCSQVV